MNPSVWIGYDPREVDAFAVAKFTAKKHTIMPIPVRGILLRDLQQRGLYTRPVERDEKGRLYDPISEHTMSTEFAISRFLTPHLAKSGWALFMDCDMLIRADLGTVFQNLDKSKAVYCVKHNHQPANTQKMDGQRQSKYPRKNWSSVMVFNCDHPSNKKLTVDMINTVPGRDLHAFCWLEDDEIGELPAYWNWLVGHSDPTLRPKIVHFTEGVPSMAGHENDPYADEWYGALYEWARGWLKP